MVSVNTDEFQSTFWDFSEIQLSHPVPPNIHVDPVPHHVDCLPKTKFAQTFFEEKKWFRFIFLTLQQHKHGKKKKKHSKNRRYIHLPFLLFINHSHVSFRVYKCIS